MFLAQRQLISLSGWLFLSLRLDGGVQLPKLYVFVRNVPETFWLWQRQCDSGEERSVRLNGRIACVSVKELELLVKKIRRSDCYKTIPLRETITYCRIDRPEVVATGPNTTPIKQNKSAVLIKVSGFQPGA